MKRNHNILGVESSEIKSDFDPLLPLQECLERDPSSSTASALAPLCISLGVPNGYINARALIERIKRAKRRNLSVEDSFLQSRQLYHEDGRSVFNGLVCF